MNLFVTGGTGYLGSAVTAGLLADGHTVRAHVRSTASADRLPAGVGRSCRAGPAGKKPPELPGDPKPGTADAFDAIPVNRDLCPLGGPATGSRPGCRKIRADRVRACGCGCGDLAARPSSDQLIGGLRNASGRQGFSAMSRNCPA